MIRIESLEPLTKGKYKLYLSDGRSWNVYSGDLRRFHLKEGVELTEDQTEEVYHSCVRIRARKKVLALLEKMDRPEKDIRFKLQTAGYEEAVIDDAVEYAKSFHYIDDERYARAYACSKAGTKSRRQIEAELRQKGIESRSVDDLYGGAGAEEEAVRRLIRRKTGSPESLSYEERQKLAASLYRKGFPTDLIRRELRL